ncbi:hypothetical protein GCM10010116_16340 [Microbispora rosea subsp. aerata]|nr:hypothetical protein GCM10010116_16340 [Microbispora rosea subsp. aerata]GIH55482.1 hypothetical protein Mro02_23960 [Microbispora rosea subsp. aerata]
MSLPPTTSTGGVRPHHGPVPPGGRAGPAYGVGGGVALGRLARGETGAVRGAQPHAAGAEGPPVAAVDVPGRQIPAPAPGLVTASVADPFGNVLGIMCDARSLEIIQDRR